MYKKIILIMILSLGFSASAFAKATEGLVATVDTVTSKFELKSYSGGQNQNTEPVAVWISYNTNTDWPVGVTDPNAILNTWVSVDATQESFNGNWVANSINIIKNRPNLAAPMPQSAVVQSQNLVQ